MISKELWDLFQEKCKGQRRYCMKEKAFIRVSKMKLDNCNSCYDLILKGGICDPL